MPCCGLNFTFDDEYGIFFIWQKGGAMVNKTAAFATLLTLGGAANGGMAQESMAQEGQVPASENNQILAETDRKSTRQNSSHGVQSRMPSSA